MRRVAWPRLLALAAALFFLAGAGVNLWSSEATRADYTGWGYPGWFSVVTGALELIVAALLPFARTRIEGVMLGALVMGAAFLTLIVHGEIAHALAPLCVLGALGGIVVLTRRAERARLKEYRT